MEEQRTEMEELRLENERLRQALGEKESLLFYSLEQKYLLLFNQLKDMIYESTPEGKFTKINPSGLELLGYTLDEVLNLNIADDLFVNPKERDTLLKELNENGFVKNYEIRMKTKEGKEIIVIETSFPIKDAEGKVLGYTGIIRDISQNKAHEQLLLRYNKELAEVNQRLTDSEDKLKKLNNEKDKFFSIIAHDLKSPFNALLNLSEFLVDDLDDLSTEEIKSFSTEINKAAHNVYDLLLNLLHWTQIKTGRMKSTKENVLLLPLVENAVALLEGVATRKNIRIINNVEISHSFYGDKTMISSVLQNLIANAIKFSNEDTEVLVVSEIKNDKIIVSVKDSGVGISENNLSKLFKINEQITTTGTANEEGTGLGLILCKELVEKNNGKIWVESKEGVGTTFSFSLDARSS